MSIILPPIFMSLFAGWMLWGWFVGESKNIPWIRHWCASLFVVTTILISFGVGGFLARRVTRQDARTEVRNLLTSIEQNIVAGNTQQVLRELRALDQTGSPDASDFELLSHLTVMNRNLHLDDDVRAVSDDTKSPEQL